MSTKFDLDAISERFIGEVDAIVEAAIAGPRPSNLSSDLNRLLAEARQELDAIVPTLTSTRECKPQAVYILQAGEAGPVKIGIAQDVEQRIRDLQCASPFKLRLLGTLDGGRERESELHRRFAGHRLEGEWFEAVPELLALVA